MSDACTGAGVAVTLGAVRWLTGALASARRESGLGSGMAWVRLCFVEFKEWIMKLKPRGLEGLQPFALAPLSAGRGFVHGARKANPLIFEIRY